MIIKTKILILLLILGLMIYGVYSYLNSNDVALSKDDDHQAITHEPSKNQAGSDNQAESILLKGAWDLLEKNDKVSATLIKKIESVDFLKYRVFEVEPKEVWSTENIVGGKVDVLMMNRESGAYDWLSLSLLIQDKKLIHASIETPNYYKGMQPDQEQNTEIFKFVEKVFQMMNPTDFGYRYRTNYDLPKINWKIQDQKIVGRNDHVYLVEVQYQISYAEQNKNLTALLVVRDYDAFNENEEKRFQIEDIKVLSL